MTTPATLHALLTGAIDYAGLFPPASLPMVDAAKRYAHYRQAGDEWALGRFVLPLTRVDELARAQQDLAATGQSWRLSVLVNREPAADGKVIRDLNQAHAGCALIDSAEAKLPSVASEARRVVAALVDELPQSVRLFAEVPAVPEIAPFVAAIGAANACAKIRTGGVTADAFPSVESVGRFLLSCADHGVPFKATAGLHHACRGRYPLTYDAAAPSGPMFGFLNVLIGAAMARCGRSLAEVSEVLATEDPGDFGFTDDEVAWRDVRISRQQVLESHATFALSFGSCSFEEPIHDLRGLGLL